ncbi:TetR/AcrR family transcriptional regulator [Nocardia pseudobrasiliensis]|uniref:TetR family transcriptional regulator n=1 Tax=Nocardia pseudobrasiliensis TaxID=45979 RepID=A0A370HW40_9NOCA|nr:TetR/AcrR family transcriptional regulator C-terminal domain-containing protein [Nocardia pseudobrasiliensis]RDI62719.1 TetR family transcriptional regulator [Nocardia pseudobrasiliensis]
MVEHSGGGDPDKLLPMLWPGADRDDGKPALGRKPGLTVEAVVTTALRIADDTGLDTLSMRRVATALGVGTMTLYTYVPGKAELLDLMIDKALRERALPLDDRSRPDDWRRQLELYADRTRTMYRRHRWLRRVSTVHPPLGPGMMDGHEYLLRALSGLGLTPAQAAAASHALRVVIDAVARVEVADEQVERSTGQSQDAWWQARMSFWQTYFDAERYPAIFATWDSGGFETAGEPEAGNVYRFGLSRLLDGIETVARENRNA